MSVGKAYRQVGTDSKRQRPKRGDHLTAARAAALPYVAVILCTLGIISVYSLAVVRKTIS
jgi:hypothetical protein